MSEVKKSILKFKGCSHFRQRLVCSILSGKPVKITSIRAKFETPGLQDFEASFLRLIDKITNGTYIEINETGTEVTFRPGVLIGGQFQHSCPPSRSISYYLEALLSLSPFCKQPVSVSLTGVTNSEEDQSVDLYRTVAIPLLEKFGVPGMEIKILKRGLPPQGGGLVIFNCGVVKELTAVQLIEEGKIKRIRGIAFSARISPQFSNRLVDSSKESLKPFTNNIYINTDHYKGSDAGLSAGFGLCLVAESTTGALLSGEALAKAGSLAEDVGVAASAALLEEILKGGYVDSTNQSLILLYMTLCPEDVSKIRFGKLTDYSIQYLRHLQEFFGIKFKITTDRDNDTVLLSCLGIGYSNIAKKVQ